MESTDNHAGHLKEGATFGSVPGLVVQLQIELQCLITRHKDIGQRMRDLRRVMRGLRELAGAPATGSLGAAAGFSFADQANSDHANLQQDSIERRQSRRVRLSLQRACRIAMMETEAASTLEEIYSRIVRRGSFPFVHQQRRASSLLRVLCGMVRDGEIRLLKGVPHGRWERIPPVPRSASNRLLQASDAGLQAEMQIPKQAQQPPIVLG